MYHRVRRKMKSFITSAIILIINIHVVISKSIDNTPDPLAILDHSFDNNIIDFDEAYSVKYHKDYGTVPWHSNDFKKHRYTIVNDLEKDVTEDKIKNKIEQQNVTEAAGNTTEVDETTSTSDYSVIPLELISTTENALISLLESTAEPDLSVIPLSTTYKPPNIVINQTVTLPTSTQDTDTSTYTDFPTTDSIVVDTTEETTTELVERNTTDVTEKIIGNNKNNATKEIKLSSVNTTLHNNITEEDPKIPPSKNTTLNNVDAIEVLHTNSSKQIDVNRSDPLNYELTDEDVPIFTELDAEDTPEVPDDYYDSKDVVPTSAPKTDALSVIFGLAGSVVESVAERVVPKSIFDLFKRMQKQNEALEAERLRSREENGGIGQFGRGLLKSISTGLTKPLSQLMAGAGDAGSLDSDRGFVGSLASGVTSVANVATSVVDSFKDRVQAIYPGTVWCGDGRSATARSGDLGLFFFTDTCCRQHDACKLYIKAGETKYGLTNTGLFTRSHCSCDKKFRECLQRTNSLVSSQIGLTYFNVLGPQCFRRSHPIIRCVRKTRITGQKCEEYELDYTKPKMWQWFDNETF